MNFVVRGSTKTMTMSCLPFTLPPLIRIANIGNNHLINCIPPEASGCLQIGPFPSALQAHHACECPSMCRRLQSAPAVVCPECHFRAHETTHLVKCDALCMSLTSALTILFLQKQYLLCKSLFSVFCFPSEFILKNLDGEVSSLEK